MRQRRVAADGADSASHDVMTLTFIIDVDCMMTAMTPVLGSCHDMAVPE